MRKPKNIEIFIILVVIAAIAILIWWALQENTDSRNLWVAGLASENDNIIFSTDGINWKDAPRPNFTRDVSDIGYGNKLWVALGVDEGNSYGNIMYSSNGKNWKKTIEGHYFAAAEGIGYGTSSNNNPLWVAVGTGQEGGVTNIMYSSNGKIWTKVSSGDSFSIAGIGVAYGTSNNQDKLWVAVGEDDAGGHANIMHSPDGQTWTKTSSGDSFSVKGNKVAYGTSDGVCPLWVAAGRAGSGSELGNMMYSENGKVWSKPTSGDTFDQAIDVAYGTSDGYQPLWVAVGEGTDHGAVKYSSNGKIWQNSSGISFEDDVVSVAYSKTKNDTPLWVAIGSGVGTSARIYYSNDGKFWKDTNYVNTKNGYGQAIAYNQELYGTNKNFYH